MKKALLYTAGIILFTCLNACGTEDTSFSKTAPRIRSSNPVSSSNSQGMQPVQVTVNGDGSVLLSNRLMPVWNGVGFVGSRHFDIVPVE